MSNQYINRVWKNKELSKGKLLVMLALADHATATGDSWPGMPSLMEKTRLTDRQIRRVLNDLASSGLITIEERAVGRGKRPHYKLFPNEKADILSDQEQVKADILYSKSGHFVHGKADIFDTNQSYVRSEPPIEPPIEPKGEEAPPVLSQPKPIDFGNGFPVRRNAKQFADGIAKQREQLGLTAAHFTALTAAVLDHMNATSIADQDTDMGASELKMAQQATLALAGLGHKTVGAIDTVFATWYTHDWRGEEGDPPNYKWIVEHAKAMDKKVAARSSAQPKLSEAERSKIITRGKNAQANLRTAQQFNGHVDPRWQQDIEAARRLGS